jgi:aryl-alcohol dehydrogenase-like predicted oxidoreductase
MHTRRLGQTELQVSCLGFGAAPIGYLDTERQKVADTLNFLLDEGVNVIDTAACYGDSEPAIADAAGHRRDDFILVSKCGHACGELTGEEFSADLISRSIDRSLKRLKTDRIDVMLLHSCDLATLKRGEAVEALVKARDQGKVRFIGYAGDNDAAAYAAALEDVSVIETSINICDQRNIDTVLPVCQDHDVGVIAKRPLANAAWRSTQPSDFYERYASVYQKRLAAMGVTPFELGYFGHADVEWPEIALKFTLAFDQVHTAVVGTTSRTNAKADLMAIAKNPLREQVVQKLRDAFTRAEQASGETWPGQA